MKPILNSQAWLSVNELALYLSLHPMTVYALIHRKKLPAVKIGGQWRVHQHQLDAWLIKQGTKWVQT